MVAHSTPHSATPAKVFRIHCSLASSPARSLGCWRVDSLARSTSLHMAVARLVSHAVPRAGCAGTLVQELRNSVQCRAPRLGRRMPRRECACAARTEHRLSERRS